MPAQDTFHTLKLSGALLAELGATPADFADKLAAFMAEAKATKVSLASAETAASSTASAGADLLARLSAVEANVAALQKAPAFDRAALLAEAEAKASSTASAILAKSGGAPLPAATVPANADANLPVTAPADPKARWAADAKLQAEFPSAEAYAGFIKLESSGRVRISSNK